MSSPARILHLAAVDFTVKHFIAPLARHQAAPNGFSPDGAEVYCACARGEYFEELEASGIQMLELPMERRVRPVGQVRAFFALRALLKRLKPDIIHCHTPFPGLLGRIAGATGGVPLRLYTVHGFHFHEGGKWITNTIFRVGEKWAAKFGHDLFFVSYEDMAAARRLAYAPDEKLHWVGNGVDTNFPSPDEARGELADLGISLPADRPVIGFIGRMVAEKGVGELISAFNKLLEDGVEASLLLIGGKLSTDDANKIPQLTAALESSRLRDHIYQTGLVPEARRLLPAVDIFALPSWREGLPVSLLEAMAAGRACVGTQIRGCRELIEHEQNGLLVEPKNSDSLARALTRLVKNEEQRTQFGEAARQTVLQSFTRQQWFERHDEAYRLAWEGQSKE